jgi:septum formation protein
MEPLILASTSPRRQDILKSLGIPFSVLSPAYDESPQPGLSPAELVELHAVKKVESIMRMQLKITIPWILGADTLVCKDDVPFGKPVDKADAKRMLTSLSGSTHEVFTAIGLFDAKTQFVSTRTSRSLVSFIPLDDDQVERYLDTGEWQGVAGGYRIQGLAACFISKIEGSWSGIVGLPIAELYAILREHGYAFVI